MASTGIGSNGARVVGIGSGGVVRVESSPAKAKLATAKSLGVDLYGALSVSSPSKENAMAGAPPSPGSRADTFTVEKYRRASEEAMARSESLERQLEQERANNKELREQKSRECQALQDIAEHFRASKLLHCKVTVEAYAERLRDSGMEDMASLLDGLLHREQVLASALEAATYTAVRPAARLPAPPKVVEVKQGLATPPRGDGYRRSQSLPANALSAASDFDPTPHNFKTVEQDEYWWSSAGEQSEAPGNPAGSPSTYSTWTPNTSAGQNQNAARAGIFARATHKVAKRLGVKDRSSMYDNVGASRMPGFGKGKKPVDFF